MSDPEKNVKVIKANYTLRAKIGSGPLDEYAVKRAQDVMDKNSVDFAPLAMTFLDTLKENIAHVKTNSEQLDTKEVLQLLTEPVMQLKANAKLFHYPLIGNLTEIMLGFLEHITKLDKDVIEIVEAQYKTINVLIVKRVYGDAGDAGEQLIQELKNACNRYFQKIS